MPKGSRRTTIPKERQPRIQPTPYNPQWSPKDLDLYRLGTLLEKFRTGAGFGPLRRDTLNGRLSAVREMVRMVEAYVDSYARGGSAGLAQFREVWKYARLAMDLQTRLLVEQVIWDTGGEFRTLLSGFRPIGQPRG